MILDKIKLGIPNIWYKTSDPFRFNTLVTTVSTRDFYIIDPIHGLSKIVNGQSKPLLVPNPAYSPELPREIQTEPEYITCHDPLVAIHHVNSIKQSPSTFILNVFGDPASYLMATASFLSLGLSSYRNAFWSDDLDKMPMQLIFTSHSDCPENYLSLFEIIEDSYPTPAELTNILTHISESTNGLAVKSEQTKDIVNSAIGLTESDFIKLSLSSIVANSFIDPKFIYDQKMSTIKRNGILEIIKPTITFDNIGGLDNAKDIIRRASILWNNPQLSKEYGVSPIRRLLMVGVPGTGKSAICQATAAELGLDLARTGISQVMNSFIGQSEANMRAVFKQIKAMSPLCVWIDEFGRDLSGGASSSHVDGGTTDRVHGEFLTGLQELPEDTFLLCAANSLDSLRPEMLRADRFDKIMFVGLPSIDERKHIFQILLSTIKTDHIYDYDHLAKASQFFTGAEITSLIKEVKFYVTSSEIRPITTQDIINYIPNIKNTIWNRHQDVVKSMYQYAIDNWDWASNSQLEDAKIILGKTSSKTELAWK